MMKIRNWRLVNWNRITKKKTWNFAIDWITCLITRPTKLNAKNPCKSQSLLHSPSTFSFLFFSLVLHLFFFLYLNLYKTPFFLFFFFFFWFFSTHCGSRKPFLIHWTEQTKAKPLQLSWRPTSSGSPSDHIFSLILLLPRPTLEAMNQ